MRIHNGLFPAGLGLTLALLMSGCPGDDSSPMDTEGSESSGSSGDPTTGNPTATTMNTSDPGTSSGGTSTGSVDDTTTGPGEESSTGEPQPTNVCVGLDQVGDVGSVFSRDGMPIDTTCEPMPMPCGGDVVGTWALESSCGYDTIPNPFSDCPGSTFMVEPQAHTGTITFENDGTFVQDIDYQNQVVFSLDTMACAMVDCATFEGFLQMGDPTASCVDDMGMCTCTIPPPPSMMVMGNYSVMDNVISLEVGADVQDVGYCINGDRLDTWNPVFDDTPTATLCSEDQDCYDELGDTHQFYVCVEPPME